MVCAQEQKYINLFHLYFFLYNKHTFFLRISKKLHGCYKLTYDAIFAQT